MTRTIRVPKPIDPLRGLLASPARKWRSRDEWPTETQTPTVEPPAPRGIAKAILGVFAKNGFGGKV